MLSNWKTTYLIKDKGGGHTTHNQASRPVSGPHDTCCSSSCYGKLSGTVRHFIGPVNNGLKAGKRIIMATPALAACTVARDFAEIPRLVGCKLKTLAIRDSVAMPTWLQSSECTPAHSSHLITLSAVSVYFGGWLKGCGFPASSYLVIFLNRKLFVF